MRVIERLAHLRKVDNGTEMPPDALIKDFEAATIDFTIPSMTLTDATYAVCLDGKSTGLDP